MKMKIFLLLVLVQVVSIRSDAASIISELDTSKSAFESNVDDTMDTMINAYIARGKTFADGNDFLKTKIIDRLAKLNGKNIYNARQLSIIYNEIETKLKYFLDFKTIKDSFNSDFEGIRNFIVGLLNDNVVAFTTSSNDPALIESCWSTNKDKVTSFLDTLNTDLTVIFNNGPSASIDAILDSIETDRMTYFLKHESSFKTCKYEWTCIFKYFGSSTRALIKSQLLDTTTKTSAAFDTSMDSVISASVKRALESIVDLQTVDFELKLCVDPTATTPAPEAVPEAL